MSEFARLHVQQTSGGCQRATCLQTLETLSLVLASSGTAFTGG